MPLIQTVAATAEPSMRSGVYAICSRSTGLVYVGSAVRIQKRWSNHREKLRKGQHHSWRLQRAWNNGGEQDFEFLVLQFVTRDQLLTVEQRYIDALRAADPGFGFNVNPVAGSSIGHIVSESTKEKLAKSRLGFVFTEEHRAKISQGLRGNKHLLGHKHSEETIEKLCAARIGKKPMLGKRHSETTKARIGSAFAGRPLKPEHSEKIAQALRHKSKTALHRKRISEAQAMFMPEQVTEIRVLYQNGYRMLEIADRFSCSRPTISNVINGKRDVYQCLL